jgi:hypothetical protein
MFLHISLMLWMICQLRLGSFCNFVFFACAARAQQPDGPPIIKERAWAKGVQPGRIAARRTIMPLVAAIRISMAGRRASSRMAGPAQSGVRMIDA